MAFLTSGVTRGTSVEAVRHLPTRWLCFFTRMALPVKFVSTNYRTGATIRSHEAIFPINTGNGGVFSVMSRGLRADQAFGRGSKRDGDHTPDLGSTR